MLNFGFWWRMIRPHTLSATVSPVFVGTAFAMQTNGYLKELIFLAMLLAGLLIQIATNLFNEYYDYKSGLDTPDSIGISGTIVRDGASPSFVIRAAIICYIISIFLGLYLCWATNWWLAVVGAICMTFGYLYAGGPLPLSRTPLGEVFSGGIMGAGLVLISYFVQIGTVSLHALAVSIPSFILVGLILTANNLRDRVGDEANGRKTLVILLGHRRTVFFMFFGFLFSFAWLFVLKFLGHSWIIFLPFLTISKIRTVIQHFSKENQTPKEMMPGMVASSELNRNFGYLLALALILEPYII